MAKKSGGICCFGDKDNSFPTFWVIVLVLSLSWFLGETGIITLSFPWLPTILVIIAIGAIIDHYA